MVTFDPDRRADTARAHRQFACGGRRGARPARLDADAACRDASRRRDQTVPGDQHRPDVAHTRRTPHRVALRRPRDRAGGGVKIVDVCAFYMPTGGGVRTDIDRKLVALAGRRHEIVVIAPGEEDREEQRGPNARVRWLRSPRFPLDRSYRHFADRDALRAILDQENADVVEVSSPWRSASMVADWRTRSGSRARLSLIAHADALSAYAYRWFGNVASTQAIDRAFDGYWRHLRRLDAQFDHGVSASASLTRRLREGGLQNVTTDPMGVEPGRFSPRLRDADLRREMLALCGLGEQALLLIGVGRHAPEKRWDMVAQATAIAGTQAPVGLRMIGGGAADLAGANDGALDTSGDPQAAADAILTVARSIDTPEAGRQIRTVRNRPDGPIRTMDDHFDAVLTLYEGGLHDVTRRLGAGR